LKIDTSFQEDHQVKLTVEIEQETLEGSKRRAAKQIAKKVKIPGFRPGKAPYDVIQKHVGADWPVPEAAFFALSHSCPVI